MWLLRAFCENVPFNVYVPDAVFDGWKNTAAFGFAVWKPP
jgi:hypothetical protein